MKNECIDAITEAYIENDICVDEKSANIIAEMVVERLDLDYLIRSIFETLIEENKIDINEDNKFIVVEMEDEG